MRRARPTRSGLRSLQAAAAFILCAAAAPTALARQSAPVRTEMAVSPLLGVAWYPEQWPESGWDADLKRMAQAHIRFVRIGEFAWSAIEPSEGTYRLDWLERAVRAAERHGIKVVLGTPTAAPPAWLTSTYPEVLRTLPDGSRAQHGGRHQASFTSAKFRALARAVVARMAERFGRDRNVIAWQIDNEIGTDDRGAETRAQFHGWLRNRYKTLDTLNARWSTAYWSQTYQDWSQIPLPTQAENNPGLSLAWRRFVSDGYRAYVRDQADVLRARIDRGQRITTNYWIDARAKTPAQLSPDQDDLDLHTVTQDLDFAAWDTYVGTGHFDPIRFGMAHDIVRGLLRRNFWVMETQPGTVNWSDNNNALHKGEVRALAWNAVGRGADALAYWQWRSAPNGQEQYHGTLVGADGTPLPIFDEIRQVGAEFARAGDAIAQTGVVSRVAIIQDYPSRWAIGWQRYAREFNAADAMLDYYKPLRAHARSVDIVGTGAPLAGYALVVAPALNVLTADAADRLSAYVRSGGHLVLGARTGMKDDDNALWRQRQPGPLADLLGARVEQWYALEGPVGVSGGLGQGQASVWAERLQVLRPDVQVLLRYGKDHDWLEGQPAAVTRRVGKGSITYVGANLDAPLMSALTARLAAVSGVGAVYPTLPADLDVAVREGKGRQVLVLTSYAAGERTVALPAPMRDVLGSGIVSTVKLGRYGVAVLETSR